MNKVGWLDAVDPKSKFYVELGYIVDIWRNNKSRKLFNIITLHMNIFPALKLGQIEFWFDQRQNPIGYICWAYVSSQVLESLLIEPDKLLHLSEWNEGSNLIIVDLVYNSKFNCGVFRQFVKKRNFIRNVIYGSRRLKNNSIRNYETKPFILR